MSYRKSTLLWAVALSLLAILFLSIFPLFHNDINAAKKVLDGLPPAVRAGLGISLKNFFTIFGFFGYVFTYVTLAGAIQATNLGVGALSREDSGKTADFLLTKPISRNTIVTAKLLASVCSLVFTNLVFVVVAFVTAKAVSAEAFSSRTFLLVAASLFLIQLAFMALGALLSVVIPKIKSVIAVTLPVVFVFFIISTFGSIIGSDWLSYVTPFKFYDATYIINHSGYDMKFVVIEAAFIIVAIAATYILYNTKDIRAAS